MNSISIGLSNVGHDAGMLAEQLEGNKMKDATRTDMSFWASRRTDFRDADLDGAEADPVSAARVRLERMSLRTRLVIARSDAVMLETRRLVTEIRDYANALSKRFG